MCFPFPLCLLMPSFPLIPRPCFFCSGFPPSLPFYLQPHPHPPTPLLCIHSYALVTQLPPLTYPSFAHIRPSRSAASYFLTISASAGTTSTSDHILQLAATALIGRGRFWLFLPIPWPLLPPHSFFFLSFQLLLPHTSSYTCALLF